MDVNTRRVAAIILGGGEGKRLYPLTKFRCKPALPFAQCKLIDVPISNAFHADIRKIFVITQFLCTSLHQHLLKAYHLDSYSGGFIQLLTPEQTPMRCSWYKGTADAVRQNLIHVKEASVDYFLILSADQLYNFNFREMIHHAQKTDADLTIATQEVGESDIKRMGALLIDKETFITDFHEKPQTNKELLRFQRKSGRYFGSMGIYLFKRDALFEALGDETYSDFGKDVIPNEIKTKRVNAFLHQGYWEDIGTIASFYEATLALTHSTPKFNYYHDAHLIYSDHSHLPGPKITQSLISQSIICNGAVIEAEHISRSVLGERCVVQKGSKIQNSILFGNDFYVKDDKNPTIETNCIIQNAILDRNVSIGKGVKLINMNKLNHYDSEQVIIRDGIIIVPQGTHLPDGFAI